MMRHESVRMTGGEKVNPHGIKFFEVVAVDDIAIGEKMVSAGMTGFWAPQPMAIDPHAASTPDGHVILDGKLYESQPNFVLYSSTDKCPMPRLVAS